MNNKYIVFLILAILVIAFLWNKNEHLDSTPISNEAIQSIASVYNKDNLTATNINATSTINAPGALLGNIGIGKSVLGGSPNWGDINWGDGTGWRLNMGKAGDPTLQVYDNGGIMINKNLGIGRSALGGSPNAADINWGDGTGWRLNMGKAGAPTMQVYDSGTVQVNGKLCLGNTCITEADLARYIRDDKTYGIQSSRTGFLVDGGGWSGCNPKNNPGGCTWEKMNFVKVSDAKQN